MRGAIEAAQAAGITPNRITGWKCAAFVRFVLHNFGPDLLKNWNTDAILSNPETP